MFSPMYSARTAQTGYPIEMLVGFLWFLSFVLTDQVKKTTPFLFPKIPKVKFISDLLHKMTG